MRPRGPRRRRSPRKQVAWRTRAGFDMLPSVRSAKGTPPTMPTAHPPAPQIEEATRVLAAPRAASPTAHPRLVSVATALPANAVPQSASRALAARMFEEGLDPEDRRLLAVFESSGIETRHFCMPLEWYAQVRTFGEMNARYLEHAVALAVEVSSRALERAGLSPADVDHVVFVSSTGLATPSAHGPPESGRQPSSPPRRPPRRLAGRRIATEHHRILR